MKPLALALTIFAACCSLTYAGPVYSGERNETDRAGALPAVV